jgi:putative transposase
MRKSRFTETQIIGMIKEQEAGLTVAEVCRKHGISPASFYKLKAKYGGMDVSDARRLKQLEEENAKLKRLVAEDRDRHPDPTWAAASRPGTARGA